MIAITGATGFIGSPLVRRLCENHPLRCLVRPSSRAKCFEHPNIEWIEGDLDSPEALEALTRNADTVIHLAALLRKQKASDIFRVNTEGTHTLLDAASKNGVGFFLYVSTENASRQDLSDPYAASKKEAENLVRTFGRHLILRPYLVFGLGDHHGLGRLVELSLRLSFQPFLGSLQSTIQPVYIDDLVEIIIRGTRFRTQGTYVIANDERISMNDFVANALARLGCPKRKIAVPYGALRFLAAFCDRFCPGAGWGSAQMDNIYRSQTHPAGLVERVFNYRPRSISEGLDCWAGSVKKALRSSDER